MALLDTFVKILKKGEAENIKINKNRLPDDDVTIGKASITFKSIDDKSIEAFNQSLKQEGYKGPGLNMQRIGEILDEKMNLNLGELNIEELLLAIQKDNEELFKFLKRDKQTIEGIVALAKTKGLDTIGYNILKRKPGEVLNVEHLVGGMLIIGSLSRKLDEQVAVIKNMADSPERKDLYKRFMLNVSLMNNVTAQVSGVASESARTLGVISGMKKLSNIDLEEMLVKSRNFVDQMDENLIDAHLQTYATLPKPGRMEFAKKGFWSRTWDATMEIYINSLLASPVTHMVNIAGNAIYSVQRTLETGMAGLIGEARTRVGFGGQIGDRVYLGEIGAESHGATMALYDAIRTFSLTLAVEGAENVGSKIDLKDMVSIGNSDNIRHIVEQAQKGEFLPMGLNIIGVMTRMPGRFLASEDAFFKVISERKVLYREAYRASQIKYETLVKSGMDRVRAKELAQEEYVKVFNNPDDNVKNLMLEEGKISTFQENPEGAWSALVNASNAFPGAKVIIPFSKTPTNIVKAVYDRTLNWSSVYKAIKTKSGADFDKAMSKLVLGNTMFASMVMLADGQFGDNIVINGSGPTDPKARKFMRANNIPPYSIGFKQDDGTYKYITFSRFDPLSGILAMASDYAYYARNSGEGDMLSLEAIWKAGTLSVAEYAMNMPFLQGISELNKASFNPQGTSEHFFERMGQYFGQKGGNVITAGGDFLNTWLPGQPFIGASSFTATMERVNNPEASNTMLNQEQLDAVEEAYFPNVMRGFYTALNQAKSRNPLFSKDLPPKLNYWGETVMQTSGETREYFSPIKIQEGGYDKVNDELIRLAEMNSGVFGNHKRRKNGLYLTALEYNKYIELFNNINVVNDNLILMKGDNGWSPTETIKEKMKLLIDDPSSEYNRVNSDDQFDLLNEIRSDYARGAWTKMYELDPSLKIKFEDPEKLMIGFN